MNIQIINTADKVKSLLEVSEILRDDDLLLMAIIWDSELKAMKLKGYTGDFLQAFSWGNLTNSESIRRTRQRLQQEFPHLRGESYKNRTQNQSKIKAEIKSIEYVNPNQLYL